MADTKALRAFVRKDVSVRLAPAAQNNAMKHFLCKHIYGFTRKISS